MWKSTFSPLLLVATAAWLPSLPAATATPSGDHGQGTARPGSKSLELFAGTHLYGAPFDAEEALGKVVVVEIGGS